MVAYSFKQRFVEPITLGLQPGPWVPGMKRQTIRADRKRHARPGEQLQLYRGMRTRQCFLIGRAKCEAIYPIVLKFAYPATVTVGDDELFSLSDLDRFAKRDGFEGWRDMREFWNQEHSDVEQFHGVIVYWEPAA